MSKDRTIKDEGTDEVKKGKKYVRGSCYMKIVFINILNLLLFYIFHYHFKLSVSNFAVCIILSVLLFMNFSRSSWKKWGGGGWEMLLCWLADIKLFFNIYIFSDHRPDANTAKKCYKWLLLFNLIIVWYISFFLPFVIISYINMHLLVWSWSHLPNLSRYYKVNLCQEHQKHRRTEYDKWNKS